MTPNRLQTLLIEWAALRLGFDPRALRLERLEAVAAEALARLGSLEALDAALTRRDLQLETALVSAITVGETYFYRQREHFDLLAQWAPADRGGVNVWSAGCSTGEEAYSLAAALRHHSGLEAPNLTLWGTDVNGASLAVAREAHYGRWSWRDTSPVAAKQLQAQALDPATRRCVRFAQHNLLETPAFDGASGERFDLIFCRNVLVYFTPLAAAQALASMGDALRPGGWLVLGNMDLAGAPLGFKRIGPPALCVFAKDPIHPRPALPLAEPAWPKPAAVTPPPPADPVAWHCLALGLIESGERGAVLKELAGLVKAHPNYLPGRFEHALALRRSGRGAAAAHELLELLRQAEGRDLGETVDGPEPLSLEFYVNSAHSFIDSQDRRG